MSIALGHSDKVTQLFYGRMQLAAGVCKRKREDNRTRDILGVIYLPDIDSLNLGAHVFGVVSVTAPP